MEAFHAGSRLSFLGSVAEPRSCHGRPHPLSAILARVCGALVCGARSDAALGQGAEDPAITLLHRLGFTRRPPQSGGIPKVLIALNRAAFEHALTRGVEALWGRPLVAGPWTPEASGWDGQSARGSFDGLPKAVHLLALWAQESALSLAPMAVPKGVEEQTNEPKAALRWLTDWVLEGRWVSGDARFGQRDFCQPVIDAGGDYLGLVNDHQPTLRRDLPTAFAPPLEGAFCPAAAANLG